MRPDMAKVVTERPRRGHAARSVKTALKVDPAAVEAAASWDDSTWVKSYEDYDDGPRRMKASRLGQCRERAGKDAKEFSDLLGPLQKYLRKQVGRPWNAVYSELSAVLDKRSLTGRHIWTHVYQEVERHCEIRDGGKVYRKAVTWRQHDQPVTGLYVHPQTGLICYRPRRKFSYRPTVDPNEIRLDDGASLVRESGIWYYGTYGMTDRYRPAVKGRYFTKPAYFEAERVQLRKRQLSRKELLRYKLRNEAAA